jgi:hypothetical protein
MGKDPTAEPDAVATGSSRYMETNAEKIDAQTSKDARNMSNRDLPAPLSSRFNSINGKLPPIDPSRSHIQPNCGSSKQGHQEVRQKYVVPLRSADC